MRSRADGRGKRIAKAAALCSCMICGSARADFYDDPFSTTGKLPLPVSERLATLDLPCSAGALKLPLTSLDAVRHALCHNPRTRQAWAAVEAQAAAVGLGQSAYWPSVDAAAGISRVSVRSKYPDQPELDSSFDGSSDGQSINLDWVLYDFGLRAANLRQERALFRALCASQNEAILAVFLDTAQAYFAAEQAQATFAAEAETEQAAEHSAVVAEAKVAAGVGLEADRLQAKTAHAQASLNRIRAHEKLESAQGALARALGARPGTPITLSAPGQETDDALAEAQIELLMGRALQVHPRIAAARAQLEAAQDGVSAARAGGRPRISLGAFADRSDTPVDRVASRQNIETSSLGLRLRAPLFEGFGRTYRIRQAESVVEGREAELLAARQDVAQAVWESYVAVRGSSEARKASRSLLESASQSFELASGRYKAGVGNIIELLRAQSDLAAARQQEVMARTRWRLARLELAASLGRIDFWMLREAEKK
ncbi:TolC family protein [Solimonas sp. K1W22B-7]|uniref:TolC family protein n=1 Tax=Solimonas sp. K1W22B-7 TaxID=2303331 RepID=UPI000E331AEF|nr:TolC family protein [Solimonas sp. K1W22B-7]AXQ27462.1 TolC family protein [Solimonas sp. K1W22B-7]